MKRKLFAVCAGIVALITVMLMSGYSPGKGQLACDYLVNGEQIFVSAIVSRKDSNKIYLDSIIIKECAASSQQNIPIRDGFIIEYDEIREGDMPKTGQAVILRGVFSEYSHATNPGEFDAAEYYHQLGIGGRLKRVEIIGRSEGYSLIKEKLFEIREIFRERLYYIFPEKEAGTMCTILLGDKSGLDGEVRDMYRRNGIIHILSISGLHITFVGMGIYKLLRKAGLPKYFAAITGCVVLILYGIMTGMGVSVCRAIVMYLIRMLSVILGRTYDMLTALGVAAAVFVAGNPLCVKQAGFLLSFGSIIGVGIICPAFVPDYGDEPGKLRYEPSKVLRAIKCRLTSVAEGVYSSFIAGLSITMMTLPIQLWFYYEVPTYAVILNLFVLPVMGLLLVTGFIAMLVPHMGIVGTVDCLILDGYEILCGIFERLPMNMWNPGKPSVISVVIYYIVLFTGVWCAQRAKSCKKSKRSIAVFATIIISVAVIGIHTTPQNSVTFLDVGQGDGIVVRTDAGGVYLFDCGSTSKSSVGEYVLKPYLKYCGISRIDAVIVSHEDTDHCNGIEELLRNRSEWGIEIKNILLPDVTGEEFENILSACKEEGSEWPYMLKDDDLPRVMYINTGTYWKDGSVEFTCMHPEETQTADDINAASACFLVESGDCTLLLTGDVEAEGEEQLLAELEKAGKTDIDILKVAHHGSKYSSSEDFLQAVHPQIAVISCSSTNKYGHPAPETVAGIESVGAAVCYTMEQGAITLTLSGSPHS